MDIHVYHREENSDQLLPRPLRCLIVGASGSGKTNLLLNFIYNREGVQFRNLYVFSRSIEQAAYVGLRDHYKLLEKEIGQQIAYFYSSCQDVVSVDDCEPNSLVVFDDCLLEEQLKIKDYFIRARHKQISCVYLSQSYGRVDMQVIRNNVNLLCLFALNKHYTKRVYDDFVGADMTFTQFQGLCNQCWNIPYGFITINTTLKPNSGKYKCNLKHNLIKTKRGLTLQ